MVALMMRTGTVLGDLALLAPVASSACQPHSLPPCWRQPRHRRRLRPHSHPGPRAILALPSTASALAGACLGIGTTAASFATSAGFNSSAGFTTTAGFTAAAGFTTTAAFTVAAAFTSGHGITAHGCGGRFAGIPAACATIVRPANLRTLRTAATGFPALLPASFSGTSRRGGAGATASNRFCSSLMLLLFFISPRKSGNCLEPRRPGRLVRPGQQPALERAGATGEEEGVTVLKFHTARVRYFGRTHQQPPWAVSIQSCTRLNWHRCDGISRSRRRLVSEPGTEHLLPTLCIRRTEQLFCRNG